MVTSIIVGEMAEPERLQGLQERQKSGRLQVGTLVEVPDE